MTITNKIKPTKPIIRSSVGSSCAVPRSQRYTTTHVKINPHAANVYRLRFSPRRKSGTSSLPFLDGGGEGGSIVGTFVN